MKNHDINPLDTLAFFNVGSHRSTSGFTDSESRVLFDGRMQINRDCAHELGLPFFVIDSNIGQFICDHDIMYVKVHTFCSLSAVLVCGSYFSQFYYSSGCTAEEFNVLKCDKGTAYIDLTLTSWLSTEYTDFFSWIYKNTFAESTVYFRSSDSAKIFKCLLEETKKLRAMSEMHENFYGTLCNR